MAVERHLSFLAFSRYLLLHFDPNWYTGFIEKWKSLISHLVRILGEIHCLASRMDVEMPEVTRARKWVCRAITDAAGSDQDKTRLR